MIFLRFGEFGFKMGNENVLKKCTKNHTTRNFKSKKELLDCLELLFVKAKVVDIKIICNY